MPLPSQAVLRSSAFQRFAGWAVASARIGQEERQDLHEAIEHPARFEREPALLAAIGRLLEPHAGAVAMLERQTALWGPTPRGREDPFDIYHLDDCTFIPAVRQQVALRDAALAKDLELYIDPRHRSLIVAREWGFHHDAIRDVVGADPSNNYLGLISGLLSSFKENQRFQLVAIRSDPFMPAAPWIESDAWMQAARMVYDSKALRTHIRLFQVYDPMFSVMLAPTSLPEASQGRFEDHRVGPPASFLP